jgi:hypothetical protein
MMKDGKEMKMMMEKSEEMKRTESTRTNVVDKK